MQAKTKTLMKDTDIKDKFIKYAIPTIVSMLIISLQCIIDGMFVSKGVGPQGLAAINITMPLTSFFFSVAIMIVSGGVVICGIAQGQRNKELTRGYTTLTLVTLAVTCFLLSAVIMLNIKDVCYALGADDELYPYVRDYLSVFAALLFFYVSPGFTEAFVRLYEKPNLVFVSGCVSCMSNIILDWILVIKLNWGMQGAAIATVSASVIATTSLISKVEMGRIAGRWKDVWRIFFNGSSEMITCIATSVSTYIFNVYLMNHVGYIGVAALTIVFYLNMIVNFSTMGMAQAMYPLIAYNLGARDYESIKRLLMVAMKYSFIIGLSVYIIILVFKTPVIELFTNGNVQLTEMTHHAATFMTLAYLVSFVNIIGSGFHTAIEKPIESALIAICKSLIFVVIPLMTLPSMFESMNLDSKMGIWLSIPVGEMLCLFVSIPLIIISMRKLRLAFVKC